MNGEPPSGTVTLLFTDIEGSTRLLQRAGDDYADLLAEHRRLLRAAFEAHGGHEVDTEGDAFFVSFSSANEAVAAAAEAQQALVAHEWPEGNEIRVRMGLHTGEPRLIEHNYVGLDVHQAARVMAAGHGGQVLVSHSTRELLDERFQLRDLGEHRLKDLSKPQRLYQLGDGEFPRLKTLYHANLPVQPTPLIGREGELGELLELLKSSRLLTLTGAGGSGKTRLALQAAAEAAEDFPDGVWFVSLAALTDPDLIESTVASSVGAEEDLASFLASKRLLLLLDNLEQLLPEAAPIVARLLEARGVVVVATSRERLAVSAEQEYPVATLAVADAVALFTARARQLLPTFEPDQHVTEITRRLDGLPLAIELAAARVKVLTTAQILDRLGQGLDLLTAGSRDLPERQRTLRTTIEWSYELLEAEEQRVFLELAVFAGSFDLAAAETVADADLETVAALLDKSLLRQTGDGRFFMLETIREYALERLEEAEIADPARRRQAEWVRNLALQAREQLRGDRQVEFLDRLTLEHANIRAALTYATAAGDSQLALAIAGSLGRFWIFRGHDAEGHRWLEAALALPYTDADDELRWRALYWDGILADGLGDKSTALAAAESALALARRLGDQIAISASSLELARRLLDKGDYSRAERLLEESARSAAEVGDEHATAIVEYVRGQLLLLRDDATSAAAHLRKTLENDRRIGDVQGTAMSLAYLALAEANRGEHVQSRLFLRESLGLFNRLRHAWGMSTCLQAAAELALSENRASDAAGLLIRADGLIDSLGVAHTGIEGELYRRTWNEVRERVADTAIERLRAGVPLGDLDEAFAYATRNLG